MLYAIMVPHRSLNFTWHHFTLSLFFPPFSLLSHFFSILLCPVLPLFALFFSFYVIFSYFYIVFLINLPKSTSEVSCMLYAIIVPHRSLNFTCHHFTLSLFFPPFSLLLPSPYSFHRFYCCPIFFSFFYVKVLPFFHCFSYLMLYFLIFYIVFLINLPRSTSEGGPGGNRYPNVTQLPPST